MTFETFLGRTFDWLIGWLIGMDIEGLTSIKYKLKDIKEEALYTLMRVEVKRSDYTYPKCEKVKKHMKCWYPKGTHP